MRSVWAPNARSPIGDLSERFWPVILVYAGSGPGRLVAV